MVSSAQGSSATVVAEPEPIELDWSAIALVIIDMQRDFMEPADSAKRSAMMSRASRAR